MNPPHGKPFYWAVAIITPLALVYMVGNAVDPDGRTILVRVMSAAIAVVYFLGLLQAIERLFRPETALARTRSLSDSTRQKMGGSRRILSILFYVGIAATFVVRLIGGKDYKDLSQDVSQSAVAFACAAVFLADICGERNPVPGDRVDFVTRQL